MNSKKYSFETIKKFVEKYDHDAVNYLETKYLDEIESEINNKNELLSIINENLVIDFIKDVYNTNIKDVQFYVNYKYVSFIVDYFDRFELGKKASELDYRLQKYNTDHYTYTFTGREFTIEHIDFFEELYKYTQK